MKTLLTPPALPFAGTPWNSYRRTIFAFLALLHLSIQESEAITDWTDIGPNNAVTVQITCHPTNANVVFYVADSGHVYRSLDKGNSYSRVSQRVAVAVQPARQLRSGANSIAIDPRPSHDNIIYYSPGSPGAGLWKSEKLGEMTSWKKVMTATVCQYDRFHRRRDG